MKITLPLLFAFLFFCSIGYAQNSYSIKGAAVDTESVIKLYNSSITIIGEQDSIMRKFTRATENGSFSINGLAAGKYIMLISYPEHADYSESFTLDATHPTHDFGTINMRLKEKILKEVLVKGEAIAIKIKGDTTEFNAKAYKIQPNDKVEDLLKQFPGMQVDKDGKITANGQAIDEVLLDGEEFFGDDPKLVTQNIRADMVDKVQMYDKKSDQAKFTGIDDGNTKKVLNVQLKEDKKVGLFGKADAGIGNDGYYESQILFNRFKSNYKFSAYGTLANDGKTSLGYSDADKLGTSNTSVILGDDGGSIGIISFGGDELDGTYSGRGLPKAQTGGAHFDDKFNNNKETISANYKIGALSLTTDKNTISQQNITGSTFNTTSDANSYAHTFRQKGDVTYTNNPDPNTNIKIAADATFKTIESDNNTNTSVDNGTTLLNRSAQKDNTNTDQKAFNASLLYNKKFKKPRRTISWNVSESYVESNAKEFLYSDIFLQTTGKDSITDQYKPIHTLSSVLNSNLVYTEPLSKTLALSLNYGLGFNNSTSEKDSYNKSASGLYDAFDSEFSNDYKFNQLTNQFGANFNYTFTKGTFIFGAKATDIDFKQTDEQTGITLKRDFINWQPIANLRYKISPSQNLNISYNGSTVQPSISQIQPVRDNSNTETIIVGNADLKPSFRNGFNVNYSSYQPISGQSIFFGGGYTFITDPIINNTTIDPTTGKTTIQYINLINNTQYNYNASLGMSRKLFWGVSSGVNLNTNGSATYTYQNSVLNANTSHTYQGSLNFNKYETKKYDFYLNGGAKLYFSNANTIAQWKL